MSQSLDFPLRLIFVYRFGRAVFVFPISGLTKGRKARLTFALFFCLLLL